MLGLDLRDGVQGLYTYAEADLAKLWRMAERDVQAALHDLLPALIGTYGSAASTLAANWYDDLRQGLEVGGAFTAIPADIADTGTHALVGWAASEAKTDEAFRTLVLGGMQKRIANFSRLTIQESSLADPRATGWQRVGNGECSFCALLIGSGAVYREASADFGAHDHCKCSAVPAFGGRPVPVRGYTPTNRNITDADRARTRAWIAANH